MLITHVVFSSITFLYHVSHDVSSFLSTSALSPIVFPRHIFFLFFFFGAFCLRGKANFGTPVGRHSPTREKKKWCYDSQVGLRSSHISCGPRPPSCVGG